MKSSVLKLYSEREVGYTSPSVCVLIADTSSPLLDSPEGGFDGDEGWMDEEEL